MKSEAERHNERLLLQQRLSETPPFNATREDYKKYLLGIADVSPLITATDIARWITRSQTWVAELLMEARRERQITMSVGMYI